ncbi:MAG: family 43 glycosylhydrolase [Lentisphaerae bacterium]|jgi:hypothetical protein|nr:family 43 glycosylhydrolase [Lentisphaerota bacterium]MBT4816466.1 family 43 glycosylhydrolase [Lentisphaerota bacterium]MBT5605319.1 family 43 glycosylhydrolase [Lentisphaerota bacterium]MBT7055891.1 family 43 glycosylhydrolase [Lentisphaerota bacterium]MBT7840947.1 family 43 glycosylhydrolase [Lentisphaerota bacterium]
MTAEACFVPGEPWLDDRGVHINAHGGGVLFHGGAYYWFGEHKISGKAGNVAHVGVHCYSSTDLTSWRDEGIALAVSDDSESDIVRECVLERPKVIYNALTETFVMWFHLELKGQGYAAARSGVAVSSSPTGPYAFCDSFRPNAGHWPLNATEEQKAPLEDPPYLRNRSVSGGPNAATPANGFFRRDHLGGQMARDMTLFVDDDGTGYHIYSSEENSTLHISELTPDFQRPSGRYVRVFEKRWMEAAAICKRQGRYYLLASGCTGWAPNEARSAVADSIWGPWEELGNPCVGINPMNGLGQEKTFGGQSTSILPVEGLRDAYIAMFDIWCPEDAIDGRYVWLPIVFSEEGMKISWRDRWDLAGFGT